MYEKMRSITNKKDLYYFTTEKFRDWQTKPSHSKRGEGTWQLFLGHYRSSLVSLSMSSFRFTNKV